MSDKLIAIGVAWFTAETWPELLAVAADRASLPDSFAEFERLAGKKFDWLVARGAPVQKVLISVAEMVEWCTATGRPIDADARAAFAALVLERRSRAH